MSPTKKRKRHRCKNHPKVVARGRCVVCGSWICKECGVFKKGQFYCSDSCDPSPDKQNKVPSAENKKAVAVSSSRRSSRIWASSLLPLLAGICLALGGIAFGIFTLRKNWELSAENRFLKEKRMDLIEIIKANNREISSLLKEIHSLKVETEEKDEKTKSTRRSRPRNVKYYKPASGLPFNFKNGDVSQKLVTLTFDGGSYANAADEILDTLNSRNVRATMFLTGRFIMRQTPLIRRIVAEGHELGNHTYSHPHLTSWARDRVHATLPDISEKMLARDLAKANNILRKRVGIEFKPFWRAPYGEKNRQICRWALRNGYLHIGWRQGRSWYQNLDSNDWIPDEDTPGYRSPQEFYDKVISMAQSEPWGINGGIILMHLGTERKEKEQQTHTILGKTIDQLRGMGYQFVTISEMLQKSGVDINPLLQVEDDKPETPFNNTRK
ncbi:MAG: polysaccharide deacetylase family protein [Chitinivibrionales bacterium]|nr:polysaccharide deacetylase family protein [Chitinivibrionales bacterium]